MAKLMPLPAQPFYPTNAGNHFRGATTYNNTIAGGKNIASCISTYRNRTLPKKTLSLHEVGEAGRGYVQDLELSLT